MLKYKSPMMWIVLVMLCMTLQPVFEGATPIADQSNLVGGFFGSDLGNTLCGIGLAVAIGGAILLSGGVAAVVVTVAAPKAAAACIGAAFF